MFRAFLISVMLCTTSVKMIFVSLCFKRSSYLKNKKRWAIKQFNVNRIPMVSIFNTMPYMTKYQGWVNDIYLYPTIYPYITIIFFVSSESLFNINHTNTNHNMERNGLISIHISIKKKIEKKYILTGSNLYKKTCYYIQIWFW